MCKTICNITLKLCSHFPQAVFPEKNNMPGGPYGVSTEETLEDTSKNLCDMVVVHPVIIKLCYLKHSLSVILLWYLICLRNLHVLKGKDISQTLTDRVDAVRVCL
jgi:hypothetical protein